MHLRDAEGGSSFNPTFRCSTDSNAPPGIIASNAKNAESSYVPGLSTTPSPVSGPIHIPNEDLKQIWSWNGTVPPTINRGIHQDVSERAKQHPDALAVQSWDGTLTYAEAEQFSDNLARHLCHIGVTIGTPVPLFFEKSRWTVVGVLGIMKAGGTFILTDPSQPIARLRTIVEQTASTFILTSRGQQDLGKRVAPDAKQIVIPHSFLFQDILPPRPLPDVPPTSPMYIIFTSGSTGRPKGVVLSHENFTSGAVPRAEAVGYRPHSRVFDFASYAFDVSIDCMLCTLANGGCICIPSEADRINDLSGAIRKSGANMAHMTPSVARVLDADIIPSLEVLGLGGEAVSTSDAAAWGRQTKVIIAYGPSECTVGCTINNNVQHSVNIGHGKGGLTWIVDPDDHQQLVPVGSVGELLIEGPVVGLGYLGEPEKTSQVFVENPSWLLAGSNTTPGRTGRLYKTGDLVRYDADGAIIFVGRKDQQVKLRGQRIELSEVEYHLRKLLPRNGQVVAEVVSPNGGGPTLVAFLAESKSAYGIDETCFTQYSPELESALVHVEAALELEVPRYMIPTAFVPLTSMPTLVSGKTNRKRIREIGESMSREELARLKRRHPRNEEPQTDMEIALHGLWTKLLGSDIQIGVHDSFLALGGDSLRAMKLVALARECRVLLTVAAIFESPVLKDMASKAEWIVEDSCRETAPFSLLGDGWTEEEARRLTADLCGMDTAAVEDVYPCTPMQEALMALSAKVAEAYVAQRVVRLDSEEVALKLKAAFDTATMDCPILRTRIVQARDVGLVQVVLHSPIEWHVGNDLERYLQDDRDEPMELGKPLVRYALISDGGKGEFNFVLTMHHALYDGWSMPLVVERVNRAYMEQPTTKTTPFKDFIRYLRAVNREDSKKYWKEHLESATGPQFPPLPWPSYQPQAGSLLEHYVPLSQLPSSGTTIATVVRGAWALVASQYSGARDVIFGETLTGRNAPVAGAEEIEGPMITTVPVRIRLCLDESVSEYLEGIQHQLVEQIPHEHLGLQHIRRLSPDALEACELRTGLVLHPSSSDSEDGADAQLPASRLVPAGDEEAAQEALKFNTYSLMLVCSLNPRGFLIMASFDSKTVDMGTMERALHQFGRVAQQLCEKPGKKLREIEIMAEEEVDGLRDLSTNVKAVEDEYPGLKSVWIVDPVDSARLLLRGGVGELLVENDAELKLQPVENIAWLSPSRLGKARVDRSAHVLYKTGRLATWSPEGALVLKGAKEQVESNISTPNPRPKPVSASSEKQRRLRNIWSRVLQLPEDEIGLNDSFFQLGGDSISAMKLVSEARSAGWSLTVAKAFQNRTLYDMTNALEDLESQPVSIEVFQPYSLLEDADMEQVVGSARASLADPTWNIVDILPVRPMQAIAIEGTIALPRYSVRYEALYFDSPVDRLRLFKACEDLVSQTEILRTVFIKHHSEYLAAAIGNLDIPVVEYEIDGDIASFSHSLCDLDIWTRMPLGAAFAKWLFITSTNGSSALMLRISHAQYDEICLPLLLRHLSALYEGRAVPKSLPFSLFVNHVIRNIPQSVHYWRELLQGSSMTRFRPDIPVAQSKHYATHRTFDISARSRDATIATLPTAAWALTLARRLSLRDVTFGEVVSGRNIDFPDANAVMGPTWQYIPVRVKFGPGWTAADLLSSVQNQHVSSSAHEAMGLREIVGSCTDWSGVDWFDTVVHQDVEHVTELPFQGAKCSMETVYPHEEPLREWKIQAFVQGDKMVVEVVTVESWKEVAEELVDEIGSTLEGLLKRPAEMLFPEK